MTVALLVLSLAFMQGEPADQGNAPTKDFFTIGIAALALGVSAWTAFQKRAESQQSIRQQFYATLRQLSELSIQTAQFRFDSEKGASEVPRHLNDQRAFLVGEAARLSDLLRTPPSAAEYLLMAWAFSAVDNVDRADELFRKATESENDAPVNRAMAFRARARFLFNEGRDEEAKPLFEQAVSTFGMENDRGKIFAGDTYERRGLVEAEWGRREAAIESYKKAIEAYSQIRNESKKKRAVERVEKLLSAP